MHKTPIQLRFNDVDVMGHVNNAVIMEFFDLGKSEFFTAAGLPPEEGDFNVMVVHFEVDFLSQIRAHDHVHVLTGIERFGNKSLTVKQQVVNSDTKVVCAECHTVMAGYSRSTHASAVIPDTIKEQISRYQTGLESN